MTTTEQIKAVQNAVGVDADGVAGPKTRAAIAKKLNAGNSPKAIQTAVGVDADGDLGPKSWEAIYKKIAGAAPEPPAPEKPSPKPAASPAGAKGDLTGKQIAVVVGHEPGGGANGEREYNKVVAKHMRDLLEAQGATVFLYEHKTKAYGQRQNEMAAAVKAKLPKCWATIELHYDDVDSPDANGHHFQYLKTKALAVAIRDEFEKRFPGKKARQDKGIFMNENENGSGFLKKAPGAACLVEPFFRSNPAEWAFFSKLHREVAEAYCVGIANFALNG